VTNSASNNLEMWAGLECTVNRVGDRYFDQLASNGHAERIADIDLFCDLGIRALRYPVLWERTQPRANGKCDWTWSDERLERLQARGVRPIVGLVHHGSGPSHTHLLDDSFATGLAAYAGAVARRYPWVDAYTPVNEPLTTARFSALYGHWYPHVKDCRSFVQALLNQCRAVVLSMKAIREVNPDAELVQTDDLGKTYSTPTLAYQAEFENERRWITWDVLCGRVTREHPLWDYLLWVGVNEHELAWFQDHPCPPDVVGLNYYVTSERYLDERLDRYPVATHGGNGRRRYADVEAVRVLKEGIAGVGTLIREASNRFGLPIAVTEAHLGCTREEQVRWLAELWSAAAAEKASGVDVRAVTPWSLLGAYDWHCLLTRCEGHYEPGVFDLRSPAPRATAIAKLIKTLAGGRIADDPVLDGSGWWRRSQRLLYPAVSASGETFSQRSSTVVRVPLSSGTNVGKRVRPLLIVGGGALGDLFARACETRGLRFELFGDGEVYPPDGALVGDALDVVRPWAVINTAAYKDVDQAETDCEQCYISNTFGPEILAEMCSDAGAALVTLSSDLVFDGQSSRPYVETDEARPLCVYGQSQADAERRVLQTLPGALVIRTGPLFGPTLTVGFAHQVLQSLEHDQVVVAAADAVMTPTYAPDMVNATLDFLVDGEQGLWHLSNNQPVTWAKFACLIASAAGFNPGRIHACRLSDLGHAAVRPAFSALGSNRGWPLPGLDDAVRRYVQAAPQAGASIRQSVA
jgi:dTDP-4-dehydrorhamnose reductase